MPHLLQRRLLLAGLLAARAALPPEASANPQGGAVQTGSAAIVGQGTPRVDIHQHTQDVILSWESFDIAPGEVTNFHQPNASATALNRILSQDPSSILGALNANGNVYLINPNGFVFGKDAVINTRGFVAATSYDAEDLTRLPGGGGAATSAPGARIENHGRIQTGPGGFVYLIAPRLENGEDAVVTSPEGDVLLAAGATVTLTDDPRGIGLSVQYTAPGEAGGEAVNLGRLVADGGFARMRADVVRQAGVVQADAVRERAGRVELYARDRLELASGSRTQATGGSGAGSGGRVLAYSERDAAAEAGAVVDVSGGAAGGDGGFAELSAEREVEVAATFRAGARNGGRRGSVLIDPERVTIGSGTTFEGAGDVVVEADDRITIGSNVEVRLADPAVAGDGSADRQSLTLLSGRHITFNDGARIVDDGSGAGGEKVWDVNLVAGADLGRLRLGNPELRNLDLGRPDLLRSGSDGGVYLSGASFDASGAVTGIRGNDGSVELARGDLTVRAARDVAIGNGGGLRTASGRIDLQAGRDVRFRASSSAPGDEGVIETRSGNIHVRAGGSVLLTENANVAGQAAIRSTGVDRFDADGVIVERSGGGDILIEAGGDVDAGVANRWLDLGPNFSKEEYARILTESGTPTTPDQVPDFDPIPVVREIRLPDGTIARHDVLGIGTQAGGNVTIVAGGSVRTSASSLVRSGGTASGRGTEYNLGRLGVFGRPVRFVRDALFGELRAVPIPGAAESRLTIVAGDRIEGDFMVRYGTGTFRAGYGLAGGVTAAQLASAGEVDALLVASPAALADRARGWLGTLARPITIDLAEASIDGVGRNGVAIRGIENPSLVYAPSRVTGNGVTALPTYRPGDAARIRSTHGDLLLVGNEIEMIQGPSTSDALPNELVRVLPPNVRLETDRGDLVLLNDFVLYPSASGGLELDVAGEVRTANLTAATAAVLALAVETTGSARERGFTLPAGLRLRDPVTGVEYTLSTQVTVAPREAARPANGTVVLEVNASAAGERVVVPAGTLVSALDGRLYRVVQNAVLEAPQSRFSTGSATFYAPGTGAASAVFVPRNTLLTAADGTRFRVTREGLLQPGQTALTVPIEAETPGVDVRPFELTLATPIAGIARATNLAPTARSTWITAAVEAVEPGAAGNAAPGQVSVLPAPVGPVRFLGNRSALSGGADIAANGIGRAPTSTIGPAATASILGPAGELPAGSRLVVVDTAQLPPGIRSEDLILRVNEVATSAGVRPALYRSLQPDTAGGSRPDPVPGTVPSVSRSEAWLREGPGTTARIRQSDAAPDVDGRRLSGSFDYFTYLVTCRSGLDCGSFGARGAGPTHVGDTTPAWLRALGGFTRVAIELAEAAFAQTGDAGPDGLFGTPDDGDDGSVVDFALITQHANPDDETVLSVPIGNASFGATPPAPGVDPDLETGLQVAGPGSARLLVGLVPHATADLDGDGGIDASEWRGDPGVFTRIDEAQRLFVGGAGLLAPRTVLPGAGDRSLTAAEAPYVPTGRGGRLQLAAALPPSRAPLALGVSAIGNVRNEGLPLGSAALVVAAAGDLELGGRGSIETYQGSPLLVQSVGGRLRGGMPPAGFDGRRGIVTLFREPGFGDRLAQPFGGGAIAVDVDGNFELGGLALAALSGSDISIYSRGGDIDAGTSSPFSSPSVFVDPSGTVNVRYQGGGIFANGGNVGLFAKRDVRIGAGITGAGIVIDAGGSLVGGSGSLSGTNISINVTGSISGTISASGSINVAGGQVAQGSSLSAGGLVAGAGAAGSNTSGGKVSSELAAATSGDGSGAGTGAGGSEADERRRRGVIIDVTSRVTE